MKYMYVVLSLTLAMLSACCGQRTALLKDDTLRVNSALRATVAFVQPATPTSPYCSGFYVSDTVMVSAAHCFTNRLIVGSWMFTLPTEYVGKDVLFLSYGQLDDDGNLLARQTPTHATILWADEAEDVAVLRVEGRAPAHTFFELGQRIPRVGSNVYAVGSPVGLTWSFTYGTVSRIWMFHARTPSLLIQTQAPIYFGSSGGPLINNNGEVVGICHAIIGDQATINFFIGISKAYPGLRMAHVLPRSL